MQNSELIIKKPRRYTPQSVIKLWRNKGFSLETLSMITKIPVAVLAEIRDNAHAREQVSNDKLTYLMIVVTVFEEGTPEGNEQEYLADILDTIISFFRMDIKSIAHYLQLTESELIRFKEDFSSFSLSERHRISMMLMHLYITLIRDPAFSIDTPSAD